MPKPEPRPARGRRRPAEIDDETWQSRIAWRWWFIGALLAVIIVIVALLRAPFFAISEVQLTGEARTSEGTILDVLAIEEGQALASYDVSGAEDEIALLPWVEQVDVTRGWPSTLRVQIRERVPAAAITSAAGREWVVVSNDGHVLERRLTPPSKVPLIVAARADRSKTSRSVRSPMKRCVRSRSRRTCRHSYFRGSTAGPSTPPVWSPPNSSGRPAHSSAPKRTIAHNSSPSHRFSAVGPASFVSPRST